MGTGGQTAFMAFMVIHAFMWVLGEVL